MKSKRHRFAFPKPLATVGSIAEVFSLARSLEPSDQWADPSKLICSSVRRATTQGTSAFPNRVRLDGMRHLGGSELNSLSAGLIILVKQINKCQCETPDIR